MRSLKHLTEALIYWLGRHQGLVALFGFVSGVASFVLVERQESLARLIAALMLVSWAWLVLENSLRRTLARWLGIEVPPAVLRVATQMVHQESLFFVLPFFLITTSWLTGQAVFSVVLVMAALVSLIDPLYHRLAQRRWLFLGYHALTLFAVLLATLPLILQLKTPQSYRLALVIAVILAFPSLSALLPDRRWWRLPVIACAAVALGYGGWQARQWVPPATLWLTRVAVTADVDASREPGVSLKGIAENLMHQQGLYAYTAIRAPRGLNERIYHVWRRDGELVDRIALDIRGGRKEGYRAWSHKQHFPARAVGHWQVQVVTEAGQLIGELDFDVIGTHAQPPATLAL